MEAVSKFFRCKAEPPPPPPPPTTTSTTTAAMGETINAYPFLIVLSVYTLTHSVTLCALSILPSETTEKEGGRERKIRERDIVGWKKLNWLSRRVRSSELAGRREMERE